MDESKDPSPTPPYGEYRYRPRTLWSLAGVLVVPTILVSLSFLVSLDLDSTKMWLLASGAFGAAFSPIYLAGMSLLGRLRGGPPLTVSPEGIELIRAGLWTLLPFRAAPKKGTLIPWADIQAIEPLPGSKTAVLIQRHGEQKRWWERLLLPANRPAGRLIDLTLLAGRPAELRDALLAWSEERLRLQIQHARLEALEPGSGEPNGSQSPKTDHLRG